MAKTNLIHRLKSIKLATAEQLKTPRGRAFGAVGLVVVSAIIVGLSTLNPAGSNSPNGNRPGSGMLANDFTRDYESAAPSDEPQSKASDRPVSGPQASAWASQVAESEAEKALRLEKSRIAGLSDRDLFLVTLKLTAESYQEAAKIAESKGDEATKASARELKIAAGRLIDALEPLAAKTKLEWPKLGVEPEQRDLQDKRFDFYFFSSDVSVLEQSTDSDFSMAYVFYVTKSIGDLVDFVDSRQMPEDKDLKSLVTLIESDFAPLSKKTNN